MRPEVIEALNAIAARDGVVPWPPVWDGDMDQLFSGYYVWTASMLLLALVGFWTAAAARTIAMQKVEP